MTPTDAQREEAREIVTEGWNDVATPDEEQRLLKIEGGIVAALIARDADLRAVVEALVTLQRHHHTNHHQGMPPKITAWNCYESTCKVVQYALARPGVARVREEARG